MTLSDLDREMVELNEAIGVYSSLYDLPPHQLAFLMQLQNKHDALERLRTNHVSRVMKAHSKLVSDR